MAVARKKNLVIRVTNDERRMLGELADTNGLNVSDYIRQHIRKAHDLLRLDLTTPRRAKR